MSNTDRLLRAIVAVVFVILYLTNVVSGTWGIVLLAAAAIFLLTAFVSFCPLYTLFGINTCTTKTTE